MFFTVKKQFAACKQDAWAHVNGEYLTRCLCLRTKSEIALVWKEVIRRAILGPEPKGLQISTVGDAATHLEFMK